MYFLNYFSKMPRCTLHKTCMCFQFKLWWLTTTVNPSESPQVDWNQLKPTETDSNQLKPTQIDLSRFQLVFKSRFQSTWGDSLGSTVVVFSHLKLTSYTFNWFRLFTNVFSWLQKADFQPTSVIQEKTSCRTLPFWNNKATHRFLCMEIMSVPKDRCVFPFSIESMKFCFYRSYAVYFPSRHVLRHVQESL